MTYHEICVRVLEDAFFVPASERKRYFGRELQSFRRTFGATTILWTYDDYGFRWLRLDEDSQPDYWKPPLPPIFANAYASRTL